jgi:hypothetical protein
MVLYAWPLTGNVAVAVGCRQIGEPSDAPLLIVILVVFTVEQSIYLFHVMVMALLRAIFAALLAGVVDETTG